MGHFSAIAYGVVASVLAAVLIAVWADVWPAMLSVVEDHASAVLSAFTVLLMITIGLLSVVIYLVLPLRGNRELGIREVRSRSNKIEVSRYHELVAGEFWFWGISAKRLLDDDHFQRELSTILSAGNAVKFLLSDGDGPALERRCSAEGGDIEIWRSEIGTSIVRLLRLSQRFTNLHVRISDDYPIWRIVCFAQRRMLVSWYPDRLPGYHSPQLILQPVEHGLFFIFEAAFREAWNKSSFVQGDAPEEVVGSPPSEGGLPQALSDRMQARAALSGDDGRPVSG